MSDNGRRAFSHILVAGTGLWCLDHADTFMHWSGWRYHYGTYGILMMYGISGCWKYAIPDSDNNAENFYDFCDKLVMSLALPLTVTEMYLHYGIQVEFSIIHIALGIIPIGIEVAQDEWDQNLCDFIILGNCLSCACISVLNENYCGLMAAVNYMLAHFVLRLQNFGEIPRRVFYNTGLCFFAYHSLQAIADAGFAF